MFQFLIQIETLVICRPQDASIIPIFSHVFNCKIEFKRTREHRNYDFSLDIQ